MELLPLSEFDNCKNPLTARAAFFLDFIIGEVGDEWGYSISTMPFSSSVENAVSCINFADFKTKKIKSFFLMEDGSLYKVKNITHTKTGNKIFNDDIQILDEVRTVYNLDDSPCGMINDFIKGCETENGIENIACQAISIIEDALSI